MKEQQIEALKSADEYLNNLKNGINKAVNLFEKGKEKRGCDYIPLIAKGIDWISKVINLTKDVQKEEITIDDMNEYLEQIVQALENEDYTLVGDIFNYEIQPILDRIHKQVKELLE